MITAGDFKKGITVEWDGGVWTIVDFQHVKPGKGAAFVRTKIKNVMTGAVVERSFNPTDKMPKAIIETKEMQYLYNDGEFWHFMQPDTFEQHTADENVMGDAAKWLKGEEECVVTLWNGSPLSVTPPNFVELKIVETDPGVKGDTAGTGGKPATLETGAVVRVPLFVGQDEVIKVDTRSGEYVSRVK